MDGLSNRELAARQGITPEAARQRVSRALKRLRRRLSAERDSAGRSRFAAVLALAHEPRGAVLWTGGWGIAAKGAAGLLGAALVIVLAAQLGQDPQANGNSSASEPELGANHASLQGAAQEPLSAPATRRLVAGQAGPPSIRGRVVDQDGQPFAGVELWVVADRDPCDEDSEAPQVGVDSWSGRGFFTDAEGRFEAPLCAQAAGERWRIRVMPALAPDYTAPEPARRVVTGAADAVRLPPTTRGHGRALGARQRPALAQRR